MSRITIRDIAKLLEVSPSTVSRALKDHPDIGKATKVKINQVAKELGYRPNYQAIHFRQRKSKLIALMLPDLGRFFAPDMVKAIEEIAKKKGYNFIIFQSNELVENEKKCIELCQNFGIDGLLVSVCRETKNVDHFNPLKQNGIPIVFLDKVIQQSGNATVIIDDFAAAYTAINHVAKKKYQKVAGAFASEELLITQQRKAGFKAALEKHQLPYHEEFCFHAITQEESKAAFLRILKRKEQPDVVFVMTDDLLASIIQVIYEEGLRIPEDIALICISNGYLPYYLNPKITFIKHAGYTVGQTAANLLIDLIEHPATIEQQQITLETYLVELDSC